MAGPAWRPCSGKRRRHHQPVIKHRDQSEHAGARASHGLCRLRRQPGADKPRPHGAQPAGGPARHRGRPLYRGHCRCGGFCRNGRRGDGGRQACRRHQGRPDSRRTGRGKLAHGGAGRRRRRLVGVPGALRRDRGRFTRRSDGDAENHASPRPACGPAHHRHVLFRRRSRADRRSGRRPAAGMAVDPG